MTSYNYLEPWATMYSRKFIMDNDLRFSLVHKFYEAFLFSLECITKTDKDIILLDNYEGYYWNYKAEGLHNVDVTVEELDNVIECFTEMFTLLVEDNQPVKCIETFLPFALSPTLLADKLERDNKKIGNCILVDGFLAYVIDTTPSVEELTHFIKDAAKGQDINDLKRIYSEEFIEKFIEIGAINFRMNFPTPEVNSKITFLATFEHLIDDVDKLSSNYEFILIDSTHKDIIDKDCIKIIEYIK